MEDKHAEDWSGCGDLYLCSQQNSVAVSSSSSPITCLRSTAFLSCVPRKTSVNVVGVSGWWMFMLSEPGVHLVPCACHVCVCVVLFLLSPLSFFLLLFFIHVGCDAVSIASHLAFLAWCAPVQSSNIHFVRMWTLCVCVYICMYNLYVRLCLRWRQRERAQMAFKEGVGGRSCNGTWTIKRVHACSCVYFTSHMRTYIFVFTLQPLYQQWRVEVVVADDFTWVVVVFTLNVRIAWIYIRNFFEKCELTIR